MVSICVHPQKSLVEQKKKKDDTPLMGQRVLAR